MCRIHAASRVLTLCRAAYSNDAAPVAHRLEELISTELRMAAALSHSMASILKRNAMVLFRALAVKAGKGFLVFRRTKCSRAFEPDYRAPTAFSEDFNVM